MVLNWLFGKSSGGRAEDLPRFYPGLNDRQLAEFLTADEHERIKAFEDVYVLPLASAQGTADEVAFGVGLSKLLIRNLMLHRDVSIHGPEDTPAVTFEAAERLAARRTGSGYVTGVARFGSGGFTLRFEAHRRGRPPAADTVRHDDLRAFVRECSAAVGRVLGSRLETTVPDAWSVGQPRSVRSLLRVGELSRRFRPNAAKEKAQAAQQVLAKDPSFAVAAWDVDDELPEARRVYLEALRRDPCNAQLCFLTFCNVWRSKGPQPEAVQFCRKAIELSPGHGKAQMCAPHAAPAEADMLKHSELGYRLLPGNSFAVNNYVLNLRRRGASREKLLELAEEGIAADPYDPTCYQRMIELFSKNKEYAAALEVAERLQRLFEPVMNERAMYCLKQNPARARYIETGQYDPAAENRQRIAELRKLLGP
jgi:hypothetical protein